MHIPRHGFVTMSVVIVMIMVGVSATLLLLIMSWNTTTSRLIERQGTQAAWYAESCAELALASLTADLSERSTASYAFDEDSCTVLPFSPTVSESFTIRAEGTSGLAYGRVEVLLSLTVDASESVTLTDIERLRVPEFTM